MTLLEPLASGAFLNAKIADRLDQTIGGPIFHVTGTGLTVVLSIKLNVSRLALK